MAEVHDTKRIAKNTFFMYIRMFVMMLVSLYTSRVILNVLGVEDYGTYNVVGGVVSMFTLLTASMSASISRYLTFSLGKGDYETLRRVFSVSVEVQIAMAVVIVLAVEAVGVWFLNTQMKIPPERMVAANWVMQCSLISFVVGLLMVPYNASIISHERMNIYAYISIWDAVMKLVIVYALYVSPFDKLKSYAVLLLIVSTLTTVIYWVYCLRNFEECRFQIVKDKRLVKEMASFAGWGMLGDGAWMLNTQGVNILMNIFFGVVLNAARGVATTVDNVVQGFVRNFMVALNPQITKSYASGDYEYMHRLIFMGSKYSYFLMLFFFVPISLEARTILTLWLKIVPDYAVVFTQLTLMSTMCMMLGNTLVTAIQATGQIRKYSIVMGLMALSNFPLTWIAFALKATPVWAYIIYLAIFFCMIFVRLHMAKEKVRLSAWDYTSNVLLKALWVTVIAFVVPVAICFLQPDSILRLVEVCCVSVVCSLVAIYVAGMNEFERNYVKGIISKRFPGLAKFYR